MSEPTGAEPSSQASPSVVSPSRSPSKRGSSSKRSPASGGKLAAKRSPSSRSAIVTLGPSPSSLNKSRSHRASPSQRQKMDEERAAERSRRYRERAAPGPTTYTPQVDEKGFEADMSVRKGAETMQNAVFVSKTKRPDPPEMGFVAHMCDPGAYDPVYLTIARRTAADSTINKLMQTGNGGFGVKSSRTLVIPADNNGEAIPTMNQGIKETGSSVATGMQQTPGPAAYEPQQTEVGREFDMSTRNGAETMPNAVFKSQSQRIGDILPKATLDNPGPGTYNPDHSLTINHLPGANPNSNLVSKVGRDSRVPADTVGVPGLMTGPGVGPGSYSARNWGNSIADDQVKRGSLTSRLMMAAKPALDALGFGAKYKARELPHEMGRMMGQVDKDANTPGPGSYMPQVDEKGSEADMSVRKGAETMQNAVFVSKTKRTGYRDGDVSGYGAEGHLALGDPGSYDPAPDQKMAYLADNDRSPSKLTQVGKASFGTHAPRLLVIPADNNGEAQPTVAKGIKEKSNSVATGLSETPGPAAYEPQQTEVGREFDMSTRNGAETMPNAVFKSQSQRIGDILPKATLDNPGPGTYNPDHSLTINHLPGANPNSNLVSKVGRDSRVPADTVGVPGLMTGPGVGPGSYSARNWGNSIADDQVKRGSLTSRLMMAAKPALDALGFGAKYKARELPHEMGRMMGQVDKDANTPGPGSYMPQVDEKGSEADMSVRKGAETMQNAVFVSKTKRTGYRDGDVSGYGAEGHLALGDPGSYDPAPDQKMAYLADNDRSPSKLTQVGKASFGTHAPRLLVIPADNNGEAQPTVAKGIKEKSNSVATGLSETPGPAAYEPQQTEVGREFDMSTRNGAETMPNAVFKSQSQRIGDILPKATLDNPGPGTYNPDHSLTINHLPGANPNSNLVSKVGRDSRVPADTVGTPGLMTGPDVGPGQYDPRTTIDGELNTIVARVESRSLMRDDASFTSTQDRNIFEWMVKELGNFGNSLGPSA